MSTDLLAMTKRIIRQMRRMSDAIYSRRYSVYDIMRQLKVLPAKTCWFHRGIIVSFLYCITFSVSALAFLKLPADIDEMARNSIHYVFREEFKQAENEARKIMKKYPEHPAGYFFYAAVLNSIMEHFQTEKYESDFYRYCDLAIVKGEEILEKEANNQWAKFFVAGANGLKGTYESRYQRWVTAFKHGWRGIVLLKELVESHPELNDVQYGIATYDYWRSAKTKLLWWLPGVEDKRENAIQTLYSLRETGVYIKENASCNLIDILLNESRFSEALTVADKMLAQYPQNMIFWWGKAKAQLGLEEFVEAEKSFKYLLSRVEKEQGDYNFNRVLSYYYLLKVYYGRKNYELCSAEYQLLKSISLSEVSQKRIEDFYLDADNIIKKIRRTERMAD